MSKKKLIILIVVAVIGVIGLALGSSYALFTFNLTKNSNFKTVVGNLELSISDTTNEDRIIMNNLEPKKDSVALTEDGYTFTLTNTGSIDAFYTVYLEDIIPTGESKTRISDDVMKVNLSESTTIKESNTRIIGTITDDKIAVGILKSGDSITYTLRIWLDYNADNTAQNKYYASRIRIDSTQEKTLVYDSTEKVLAQFKPSELGEAVLCSYSNGIYYNCAAYETIEEVTKLTGVAILTNDIAREKSISVGSSDLTLDLNGKTINAKIYSNYTLTIEDTKGGGSINGGSENAIYNTGTLTINGGTYTSDTTDAIANWRTMVINDAVVTGSTNAVNSTYGMLNINGGIYNGNVVDNAWDAKDPEFTVIIKGGTFNGRIYGTAGNTNIIQTDKPIWTKAISGVSVTANDADKCTENPNDTTSGLCVYSTDNYAVLNTSGSIKIDGGTYISENYKVIYNNNYSGSVLKILNGTFIGNDYIVLDNNRGNVIIDGGTFTNNSRSVINASSNSSVTINGGTFTSNTGVAFDSGSSLTSKITGGTFKSKTSSALRGSSSGTLNVTGGTFISESGNAILISSSTGNANICNAVINSGGQYDIYNNGTLNYNNVTFSNGTLIPDSGKIYNSNLATTTEADTCPVVDE